MEISSGEATLFFETPAISLGITLISTHPPLRDLWVNYEIKPIACSEAELHTKTFTLQTRVPELWFL